ncbi:hypothetical protein F5Y17DRAFT_431284 [Xylariaceae sp. FL0594]|nr:hypothetical protein F5Y17DRAFT_431284 [Xylariaceae sp. FL0594]
MPTCCCFLRQASGNIYRQNLAPISLAARHHIARSDHITPIAPLLRQSRTYATVSVHTASTKTAELSSIAKTTRKKDESEIIPGSKTDWAVRKELEYLKDPVDVAYHVRAVLKKGQFEHAAHLTRIATKSMDVVVSWNHLIDYQLRKDSIHHALKLFNEMKKRGLKPNVRTYTTIFRGCALSKHSKLAVSEAVALYHNMSTIGRIRPNTIHMNAVISVCAKAGDLDSMFSILQTCDDNERSPDSQTYTTILAAMRHRATPKTTNFKATVGGVEVDLTQEKKDAVRRAKMLWEDVIKRWKMGGLVIDETLVCAMGRVLLLEGYHGAEAVPKLLEQTMKMPANDKKSVGSSQLSDSSEDIQAVKVKSKGPLYATPGNNTLSLILEALRVTGKTSEAKRYWQTITSQHGVVPDENNWTQLFQTLHKGKNSGQAAAFFQMIPGKEITPKQMRTAMDICLRDNLNPKAVDNAEEIFMYIKKHSGIPDVRTLRDYLRVAWATRKCYDSAMQRGKEDAYHAWARKMNSVLDHLWHLFKPLAEKCEADLKANADYPEALGRARNFKAEAVALFRKMVAAYDYLVTMKYGIPEDVLARDARNRNDLNRYVVAHFEVLKYLPASEREGLDDADVGEAGAPERRQSSRGGAHRSRASPSRTESGRKPRASRKASETPDAGEGHGSFFGAFEDKR